MKRKYLFMGLAALLASGGLWLSLALWSEPASDKTPVGAASETPGEIPGDWNGGASPSRTLQTASTAGPGNHTNHGRNHRPPDPSRKFRDFTPEERVKFLRRGHGPGG